MSEAERLAAFLKSTGNPLQMAAGDMITELLRRIKELGKQLPKESEWITTRTENHDGEIYCKACDHDAPTEGDYRQVKTNYCPNCGARMRTVTDCHTLEKGGGNA